MTPQEFKAWFEGYTEAMDEKPTGKQWERIKARVAEIDGRPTTHTVFHDWWRPYVSWHSGVGPQTTLTWPVSSAQNMTASNVVLMNRPAAEMPPHQTNTFNDSPVEMIPGTVDISACFSGLGRMDARADLA